MSKRTLESLQKQYARTIEAPKRGPGMGGRRGPGPGAPRAKGKPKNTKKTIGRILKYVAKYKIHLIIVFLCMLVSTLTSLCGSYMLAPIINRIQYEVTGEPVPLNGPGAIADSLIKGLSSGGLVRGITGSGEFADVASYVLAAVFILACVYLVGVCTSYLQARLMLHVSQNATEAIRNDLFNSLQKLPVRYFDANTTGEIMSRFTNDVDNIDTMMNSSLTSMVSGVINLVGTFIFMITTNIWLTLIMIVFIPVFAKGGAALAKISGKYYAGQQAALGAVNGYIEETVTGQKIVKVFNHEKTCTEEFGMLNGDLRGKQFKAQFWGSIMGPVMGNTSQITYAVTVGTGGVFMALGMLGAGDLTVFANYSRQFSMPINMISQNMSTIFAALAGAERVFSIMDMKPEEADRTEPGLTEGITGDVEIDNVTFGYNPDKTVLKNITLHARPGQKIAFVGSTGAGKTTVTNLINRFYDVWEGSIRIDGKDVREYDLDYLRKNVSMVLQDTHLFTGTVMENIRYGRLDATDEEVIDAAKTASAHSFIMRLSDGYSTMIEGDGANLSQGQKQLLNIARAALSKAPILVLDEATSSVDTRTERHIEHGMDRLMKNRTTFVIAHRLSTVRNSDAIMVLEHGEIIERGDHETLLGLKGRYYELYTGLKELD